MAKRSVPAPFPPAPPVDQALGGALFAACLGGMAREAMALLRVGADPKWSDAEGRSCLMAAIDAGLSDACLRALAERSDLAAMDGSGDGALHRAARCRRAPLLEWVGADPALALAKDGAGRRPSRDAAFAHWAPGIGALLLAEGGGRLATAGCLEAALRSGVPGEGPVRNGSRKASAHRASLLADACLAWGELWPGLGAAAWERAVSFVEARSPSAGAARACAHARAWAARREALALEGHLGPRAGPVQPAGAERGRRL